MVCITVRIIRNVNTRVTFTYYSTVYTTKIELYSGTRQLLEEVCPCDGAIAYMYIDILICSISISLLVNTTTNTTTYIYMRILEASRSYTTTTLRPFWDFPQLGKKT